MLKLKNLLVAGLFVISPQALTLPANAETVQPIVKASTPILTVADFFPGSGILGSKPIFRAPDLGEIGHVDAHIVTAAAHAVGYTSAQAGRVDRIQVERMAVFVNEDAVIEAVEQTLRDRLPILADNLIDIRLSRPFEPFYADPTVRQPFRVAALRASPKNPAFEAAIEIIGDRGPFRVTISGLAVEMTDVVIANRALRQGDIIAQSDLSTTSLPRSRAPARQASLQSLLGKELARSIGRGTALQVTDVQEPTLVKRGDSVMLTYRRDNLALSVVGEALSSGARGATIRVLNSKTRRTLEGHVLAAGHVEVGPPVATRQARADLFTANITGGAEKAP